MTSLTSLLALPLSTDWKNSPAGVAPNSHQFPPAQLLMPLSLVSKMLTPTTLRLMKIKPTNRGVIINLQETEASPLLHSLGSQLEMLTQCAKLSLVLSKLLGLPDISACSTGCLLHPTLPTPMLIV